MTSLLERFVDKYGRLPTEVDPDYLELLRMTKHVIRDRPIDNPGKCVNCGSAKVGDRKYVDTQSYVEWYGNVLICSLCVAEFARSLCLFEDLEQEVDKIHSEVIKRQDLMSRGDEILKTLEEIRDYYAGLHSVSDDASDSDSPVVEPYSPPSSSTKDNRNATESDRKAGGPQRPATKSNASTGRKDVPSLTDLLRD